MKRLRKRKSIRLQGYDYTQEGWYFVTICIQGFEEILGDINQNGIFTPNEFGKIVENIWNQTTTIRPEATLDVYQMMPNHFHGIVVIGNKDNLPNIIGFPDVDNPPTKFESPSNTLGAIIRGFKGYSTKHIRLLRGNSEEKIWQSNYYERIIRNEDELNKIRAYIKNNPKKWNEDKKFFQKLLAKMNKL